MLDLFRVLCCSYGHGFRVIEVWAGSEHGASEFAKEVMHDANCVMNCELIAEGVCFN